MSYLYIDSKKVELPYDKIEKVEEIDGKLIYLAEDGYDKDIKRHIIYDNNLEPEFQGGVIYDFDVIDNKLIYYVYRNNPQSDENLSKNNNLFIEKQYGILYKNRFLCGWFDQIYDIEATGDEIYFVARTGSSYYLVDSACNNSNPYISSQPKNLVKIGNQLTYNIDIDSKQTLVRGNKIFSFGDDLKYVDRPINYNGKLVFIAIGKEAGEKKHVVIYNGKIYSKENEEVEFLFELNNELGYVVSEDKNHQHNTFIVYNGEEIGKNYNGFILPYVVNSKLAYVVYYLDGEEEKAFIVYNNQEILKDKNYFAILNPVDVQGKLAFWALVKKAFMNNDGESYDEYALIYDGKEIQKSFKEPGRILNINGKLVYSYYDLEENQGTKYLRSKIVYDDFKIVDAYNPADINGKLAYLALPNNYYSSGDIYIIYGNRRISYKSSYDDILFNINGKLAFIEGGIIYLEK